VKSERPNTIPYNLDFKLSPCTECCMLSFPSQTFSRIIPQHCPQTSSFHTHLPAYEDGTESVPKRRHINFRRRGITQKKAYNKFHIILSWRVRCFVPRQFWRKISHLSMFALIYSLK